MQRFNILELQPKEPPKQIDPLPVVSYDEAFSCAIPKTEAEWEETKLWKKVDANDIVHAGGPRGFRDWLNSEAVVKCVWRSNPAVSSLAHVMQRFTTLREPVVDGLLRRGEVCNVIAAAKQGKSWLVMALVMNVIGGGEFLSKFKCAQGRVLLVDNELHAETLSYRAKVVLDAHNIPRSRGSRLIDTMLLRGTMCNLVDLEAYLKPMRPRQYNLIVLDAFYKFYPPECNENSNSDVGQLYVLLDKYAMMLDCAIVVIHHASKGIQSEKSITDVGSGAGTISRAADTHIILRQHETPGVVVVDAVARSWPPGAPFCAKFNYPKWELADECDPEDLKGAKRKAVEKTVGGGDAESLKKLCALITKPMTVGQIVELGKQFKLKPWHWDRVWRGIVPDWIKSGEVKEVREKSGRTPAAYQSVSSLPELTGNSGDSVPDKHTEESPGIDFENCDDDRHDQDEDFSG